MTAEGLTVEGLSVDRGGRPVLRNLSFHLPPGGAIVVTGSNGAGKSTLLRAVAGLIPRVGGRVRFAVDSGSSARRNVEPGAGSPSPLAGEGGRRPDEGLAPKALRALPLIPRFAGPSPARGEGESAPRMAASDELQEQTSYLGHGNGLKLSLSAAENLRFIADWNGSDGLSPAEALASLDLPHVADFPVSVLSAGQRRRVALAGLLVANRPVWLLDEPATALDAASEALLTQILRTHLDTGGLVLAAIHGALDLPARQLRLGPA